jgi:hypothetical protein
MKDEEAKYHSYQPERTQTVDVDDDTVILGSCALDIQVGIDGIAHSRLWIRAGRLRVYNSVPF